MVRDSFAEAAPLCRIEKACVAVVSKNLVLVTDRGLKPATVDHLFLGPVAAFPQPAPLHSSLVPGVTPAQCDPALRVLLERGKKNWRPSSRKGLAFRERKTGWGQSREALFQPWAFWRQAKLDKRKKKMKGAMTAFWKEA